MSMCNVREGASGTKLARVGLQGWEVQVDPSQARRLAGSCVCHLETHLSLHSAEAVMQTRDFLAWL